MNKSKHIIILAAVFVLLVGIIAGRLLQPKQQSSPPKWSFLTVKFSPRGGATEQIISAIGNAQKSVKVLAYSFTSEPIINALINAHKNGILVEAILDDGSNNEDSSGYVALKQVGIRVLLDNSHKIQHNKVIIIDDEIVLTGSFNFSKSAEENNAENSVPIFDPSFVKLYLEDYKKHLDHSK